MSPQDTTIGDAALAAGRHDIYEQIYPHVSQMTGMPVAGIKAILERLEAAFVLHKHGGPAHNTGEDDQVGELAKAWYGKGDRWGIQ